MNEKQTYYKTRLQHLETPEFVAWFVGWYGYDGDFVDSPPLCDLYWSERRFALMGWHAAMLPNIVAADRRRFVRSLQIKDVDA